MIIHTNTKAISAKPGCSCKSALRKVQLINAIVIFVLLLCVLGINAEEVWPALPGDRSIHDIQESNDIRKSLYDSLLNAAMPELRKYKPVTKRNPWALWSVSVDNTKDASYILIVPERNKDFVTYTQGSWIIKRSNLDGSFMQAKVFLKSDPGCFARIYPNGDRSKMDIVVYGGVLYKEVPVALPFNEVLRSSFSRTKTLTAQIVDWDLFSPDPALYKVLHSLEASIRQELPFLRYADDAAIDYDGRKVLISTLADQAEPYGLNCSGFVKWIADGILNPISGSFLSVELIKERMIDLRGSSMTLNYEEKYDPYFGLDWSRALAKAVWSGFYPALKDQSALANDVNDPLFALRVKDSNPVNGGTDYEAYSDNFSDAGFDVRGLKAVLFLLASKEPGRFYLAQFNARDEAPPRLRRYYHIAALFPYFSEDGVFHVTVFESAEETSLESILARKYEFVKLIRMPSSGIFVPQKL